MRREAEIRRLVLQDIDDMFVVTDGVVRLGEALDLCKDMAHPIFVHAFFRDFIRNEMAEREATIQPLVSPQGYQLQPGVDEKSQLDVLKKTLLPLMAFQAAYDGQRVFANFGEKQPRIKVANVRQMLGLEELPTKRKRQGN